MMCARRKNGQLRQAMDYRSMNVQTISNSAHPIQLLEHFLNRLGNARFFSTVDLKYNRDIIRCLLEIKIKN